MNRTMAMETPELKTLADILGEYWGYLVSGITAIGVAWAFYRRYVRGKYTKAKEFVSLAVNAPYAIVAIQNELQFENGVSLRDRLITLGEDVVGLRRMMMSETANRRMTLALVETPIFECNKDGSFLWANPALLKMANRGLHQMVGDNWRNSVATPDRDRIVDEFERAVDDGTDCRLKFRLTTGDDTEEWVVLDAICNKDDLGNVLGFIGNIRLIRDPRIHATE